MKKPTMQKVKYYDSGSNRIVKIPASKLLEGMPCVNSRGVGRVFIDTDELPSSYHRPANLPIGLVAMATAV